MKYICISWLIILTLSVYSQSHNLILPQPQKVTYGKGQLAIKGLTIGFAHKPGKEDLFAARELAGILSEITSSDILVQETSTKEPSIIFERTGNVDALPVYGEKPGSGSRESYKLKVTKNGIRITSPSSAGLFYGVQTLRQIIKGSGDKAIIPEVDIEDWPSLAYRGFMMDMSHLHFPKIEELKRQIDFLSRWKANQYIFYSEASIELDGYPILMADARYTKEQVKDIIEYAKVRHIDVIPHLDLYGHLHDLFRLEHYSDLAVIPHGGEFKPEDPRVKPIVEDWVTQIAQLFPSPFFLIGLDETVLLEWEARRLNKPPEDVFLGMLKKVAEAVEKQGKHPISADDIIQKYPSIIPKLPEKLIALSWHYFPLTEDEYAKKLSPYSRTGREMIIQSAIMNWSWVVPAYEMSFQNTDLLIPAGRKFNTIGFINSGWTDVTHALMRLVRPDMAYGCAASWQSVPVDRDNFFKGYTMAQYHPALAGHVEKALQSFMQAESLIRKSVGPTDEAFWANPFSPGSLKMLEKQRENIRNGRLAAEDAQMHIREALKSGVDTTTLFAMLVGTKLLDYLALKYLYAAEINDLWKQLNESPMKYEVVELIRVEVIFKYHSRTSDMLDAVAELKDIFQKAWLNEYTTFRLRVALGKYDYEFQFWLRLQRRLEEFHRNYRENKTVPSLESIVNMD